MCLCDLLDAAVGVGVMTATVVVGGAAVEVSGLSVVVDSLMIRLVEDTADEVCPLVDSFNHCWVFPVSSTRVVVVAVLLSSPTAWVVYHV